MPSRFGCPGVQYANLQSSFDAKVGDRVVMRSSSRSALSGVRLLVWIAGTSGSQILGLRLSLSRSVQRTAPLSDDDDDDDDDDVDDDDDDEVRGTPKK